MAGIDGRTGLVIDNLASAFQGVDVILSTSIGTRVMRREFGSGIPELLGRLVKPSLFAVWLQLVGTAIDLWEPRFRVRRVTPRGSVDDLRLGKVSLAIEVDYRPRGHLGDFRVERVLAFDVYFGQRVRVST
ncbi:GPW/gp25 family protein [Arvimicrobium flavum]|uniref:GPW/gp25 family protein n=1 Tax=Arvimicrobium flavum TaxID=3393320 RepID=UPI00237B97EA|nr:GPW/gp25 family protein [Mesorhizobium shangrilense]